MQTLYEDKTLGSRLVKIDVSIKMEQDAHVPDTMLLIRVLPMVAVVGQSDRVERSEAGGTVLDLYIKFLPEQGTLYGNLIRLAKMIKKLPGVRHTKIEKVGGRPVTYKGNPIVI
jgi:hypothetical protein